MSFTPAGQYIPRKSFIHQLDARVKIIGLLFLLSAVIVSSTPFNYVFITLIIVIVLILTKLPFKIVFGSVSRMKIFFAVIFVMNALFFDGENLIWSWGIFSVSTESLAQGLRVTVNIVLIMVLSNILTCSTAPMETTAALITLMHPLKFIGIPVEDAAMIIGIAIQFIPTLSEEADMIKKAQIARGARFESKKISEKAASFLPLIVPIFLSSFRRADELANAMEARGYRNARGRTKKEARPLRKADFIALLCSLTVLVFQWFVF